MPHADADCRCILLIFGAFYCYHSVAVTFVQILHHSTHGRTTVKFSSQRSLTAAARALQPVPAARAERARYGHVTVTSRSYRNLNALEPRVPEGVERKSGYPRNPETELFPNLPVPQMATHPNGKMAVMVRWLLW